MHATVLPLHKEILILKGCSQLTFIENEVNLDEISFEYIDINGNVTVLTEMICL